MLDRVLSVPLLIVVAPLIAVAGVWIRVDGGRPVLLGLPRSGRGGRVFRMWKLRTMRAAGPAGLAGGSTITAAADGRVTRPGRWLRTTRLDELPQVVNVLRGEMALIGPRPETPDYVDPGAAAWAPVLAVVPAITGPSQLVLADWEASILVGDDHERRYAEDVLPVKLAIDRWYVEHGGPVTDLLVVWGMVERYVARRPTCAIERRVRREVPEAAGVPDRNSRAA